MPILIDTLIEGIKEGNIYKEIEISHVIDGIIFLMGIDINFKYNKEYKKNYYMNIILILKIISYIKDLNI